MAGSEIHGFVFVGFCKWPEILGGLKIFLDIFIYKYILNIFFDFWGPHRIAPLWMILDANSLKLELPGLGNRLRFIWTWWMFTVHAGDAFTAGLSVRNEVIFRSLQASETRTYRRLTSRKPMQKRCIKYRTQVGGQAENNKWQISHFSCFLYYADRHPPPPNANPLAP